MSDPAASSVTQPEAEWVVFDCPACAQPVKVRAGQAGSSLQCPGCQEKIRVPGREDQAAPKFRSFTEGDYAQPEESSEAKGKSRHKHGEGAGAKQHLPAWERDRAPEGEGAEALNADKTTTTVSVEVLPDGSVVERRKRTERKMLAGPLVKTWKFLSKMSLWTVAALGVLIIVGTIFAVWYLARSQAPEITVAPPPAELFVQRTYVSMDEREAAAAVVTDFLQAVGVDAKLPYVRFSDQIRPIMEEWYRAHPDRAVEVESDDASLELTKFLHVNGMKFVVVTLLDKETHDYRFYAVQVTGEGQSRELRVDWETAVGWQAMTLSEFRTGKPTSPQPFRVLSAPGDYYNGPYADETKWFCCELTYPGDADFRLWGYFERDSPEGEQLLQLLEERKASCILNLAFRVGGGPDNQVTIHDIAAAEWFLPDGPAQGLIRQRPGQ